MGEIIQIHVGQAGVQIANACWELYCLEHGIRADGTLCDCPCDDTFKNFFSFKDSNKVVPRTVLVDSEPTVIDQIRTGPYGCLYSPGSLITGKEDSGSNFARGYYTMGAELIDVTMESIRTVAESCCNLRGFLIFRSVGGGTGSGLGNLIVEQLKDSYDRVPKMEFAIFPSPSISPLIVEPYNAMLAAHLGMDSIECTFILDNEALYDICAAKLNICSPRYKNLNRIIAQIASTFTTSQRFASECSISFAEFQTNLVPYPRIHFPVVSYAPFIPGTGSAFTNLSTEQITNACFEPCSQLVRCDPTEGKYMSCVLLYRGNVATSYINSSIYHLKNRGMIRFVDWQPTGFKIGLNSEPPFAVPCGGLSSSNKALLALSNNTIIQKAWIRLMAKFNCLYNRGAFIHHYAQEGLEDDAFKEASEDISTLIADYKEVDDVIPPLSLNQTCPDESDCGAARRVMSPRNSDRLESTLTWRQEGNSNNYCERDDDESCPLCGSQMRNNNLCGNSDCFNKTYRNISSSKNNNSYDTQKSKQPSCDKDLSSCAPTMALPSRNCELDNKDTVRRFKSLTSISESEAPQKCQRRSKSHEPCTFKGDDSTHTSKSKQCKNLDLETDKELEDSREKLRFCGLCLPCRSRSSSRRNYGSRCCPGEFLKLPPPRQVGKETLGEALTAKERFCSSTLCTSCPRVCASCNGVGCKFCCDTCDEPSCCCQVADPCLDPGPKQSYCSPKEPCIYPVCCNDDPCCSPCNSSYNIPCKSLCKPCNPCNPCKPCSPRNKCNPCNPCNPCKPCNPWNPCNPCNPCKNQCRSPCCAPSCENTVKTCCYNACDVITAPWCRPKSCCSPCDEPLCCSPCSKPCSKPCCENIFCSNLVKPCCDEECNIPRPLRCCTRIRSEFPCTPKLLPECCNEPSPCCSPCNTPCCAPKPCCDNPCNSSCCENPCNSPCCDSKPCCTNLDNPGCCPKENICSGENKCCTVCEDPCCSPYNSTCSSPCGTPCCSPCCTQNDCHDDLCCRPVIKTCCSNDCDGPEKVHWVVHQPRCRPCPKRPKCFCCYATDDTMYCNSDYCVPRHCCRPQKCPCPCPVKCFCRQEICGIFNSSSAVLVAPQCCPKIYYQQEQMVWCPNNGKVSECFPQCKTVLHPRSESKSLLQLRSKSKFKSKSESELTSVSRQVEIDDDLRLKPRFPGQIC